VASRLSRMSSTFGQSGEFANGIRPFLIGRRDRLAYLFQPSLRSRLRLLPVSRACRATTETMVVGSRLSATTQAFSSSV
jgi:hypothetical protein